MNQAPIKQDQFEALEAYVMGSMDPVRRGEFEEVLARDEALRAELELQREHLLAVEMGGVQRLLEQEAQAHRETGFPRGESSGWGWLKYAAVVALMTIGAVWWATRPDHHEQLFAQYHVPDPGLPVPMSAVDHPEFHDAMVAYKLGDLEEASSKWGTLLQQEPANDTLLYYIAQAELQLGNTPAAIGNLEQVVTDSTSLFRDKARWYLLLAYLRQNDREAMKAMALEQHPVYGERVRTLEAELDR